MKKFISVALIIAMLATFAFTATVAAEDTNLLKNADFSVSDVMSPDFAWSSLPIGTSVTDGELVIVGSEGAKNAVSQTIENGKLIADASLMAVSAKVRVENAEANKGFRLRVKNKKGSIASAYEFRGESGYIATTDGYINVVLSILTDEGRNDPPYTVELELDGTGTAYVDYVCAEYKNDFIGADFEGYYAYTNETTYVPSGTFTLGTNASYQMDGTNRCIYISDITNSPTTSHKILGLKPGTAYTFTCRFKADRNPMLRVSVIKNSAGGYGLIKNNDVWGGPFIGTEPADWQTAKYTFTLPEGAGGISIAFRGPSSGIYLDDFHIEEAKNQVIFTNAEGTQIYEAEAGDVNISASIPGEAGATGKIVAAVYENIGDAKKLARVEIKDLIIKESLKVGDVPSAYIGEQTFELTEIKEGESVKVFYLKDDALNPIIPLSKSFELPAKKAE